METTFKQQISGRQWAWLAAQVWQCNDGTRQTGLDLARLLSTAGTLAFPVETVERSPIGAIIRAGINSWERVD